MPCVWIVDDEANMGRVLRMLLEQNGYQAEVFSGGVDALEALGRKKPPDCILSDLRMPGLDGLEFYARLKKMNVRIPFVVLTGYGTIELAVQAIKMGAEDFLTKPFNSHEVLQIVSRVLRDHSCRPDGDSHPFFLVFRSAAMHAIIDTIDKIAGSSVPVLITGESGTGKEGIARRIHESARIGSKSKTDGKFVPVNCAAIPLSLFESELFGHARGSFTGATENVTGKIAHAEGGTLFLDEIGELALDAQTKLLRFLEDYRYRPVGSNDERQARVRVVCATNQSLRHLIEKGRFRKDLYYRINTFVIAIPPLRDRREDIIPIANHFLSRFARIDQEQHLTDDAEVELLKYDWPGNVRELRSVIQRAIILTPGGKITSSTVSFDREMYPQDNDGPPDFSGLTALQRTEKETLLQYLEATGGNVTRAAELIGVSRSTLRYRLEKYGLTNR